MTYKNAKTILFAGLIAAMILPFSGMLMAEAASNENVNDKACNELLDKITKETNARKQELGENYRPHPSTDEELEQSRIQNKSLNDCGIQTVGVGNEVGTEGTPPPQSDADKKYYQEQSEVLEKAQVLHDQINTTTDLKTKAALESELENMKIRMAEVGIFAPEDEDNEELHAIHDKYQGVDLDPFQSPIATFWEWLSNLLTQLLDSIKL